MESVAEASNLVIELSSNSRGQARRIQSLMEPEKRETRELKRLGSLQLKLIRTLVSLDGVLHRYNKR